MVNTRKIVKVFLASPSELWDERIIAKLAVDEFNNLWADSLGYHVELVGWEDTVSVYGRPQTTINRDLEKCEFFIGMMWKRWGTPPDVSGVYTSGFEEEFFRSVDSRKASGRPEISLFFKDIDPELLRDPGHELQKVLEFKNKIVSEKTIYFETFADASEFGSKVRRCVTRYVQRLSAEAVKFSAERQERPSEDTPSKTVGETKSTRNNPLSVEGARFLREFVDSTEGAESVAPSAVEISRFRLLASIIKAQGNDEYSLGVHDANILFAQKSDLTLSRREIFGLIHTALDHYSSENTPLWHWFVAVDGFTLKLLSLFSLNEPVPRQLGTLAAMSLLRESLPSEPLLDRAAHIKIWLRSNTEGAVKVAALGYLAECGIVADLPAIKTEFDKSDYQTAGAAVDAIIRINFRESREKAIAALYELQTANVDKGLLGSMFENNLGVSTDLLLEGTAHKSADVRRIAVKLLRDRNALAIDVSERLLSDADAAVRYEALQSLIGDGKIFSDDEVKRILVKPASTRGFGFGVLPLYREGEEYWDRFLKERMLAMTDRELEAIVDLDSPLDKDAQFILAERHFSSRGEQLRQSVLDQFKTDFAASVSRMEQRYGSASDAIEKTKGLEEFLRKKFTRKALGIICRHGESQDLTLVRRVLGSGFVNYSSEDIEYLRRFGEWEDIPLLISSIQHFDTAGASLLSTIDEAKYRMVARAIYSMGRMRFTDLLSLEMPPTLLARLIVLSSDTVFRALDDEPLLALFLSEHNDVRKAAALKCIRSLAKGRLKRILDKYPSAQNTTYYNVIHWLDLGISAPRERVVKAAERAIRKTWH